MTQGFTQFNSQTYGNVSMGEMLDKLLAYVRAEPGLDCELIVGTDSLQYAAGKAEFVSAIVVHRTRNGGIYFWTKTHHTDMHVLQQRIFQEATYSLQLAQLLIEKLKERNISDFNLSIHVDVGPNGKTRDMVKQVVGMIRGSGFDVKTKPDSYAASCVADRHI
jgi:uncharacterized protein